MRSINTEFVGIAKGLKIVIVMTAIPNNEVIQLKTNGIESGIKIRVKWIKTIFYSKIHDINDAI